MWRSVTKHEMRECVAVPEMATITYVIILYAWVRKMMVLKIKVPLFPLSGLGLVSARLAFRARIKGFSYSVHP
jgi:hypothetical protein